MDERQTALIAEREKEGEKRPFSGPTDRPSQEVVQLSAASYLKCRKKTAEGMERKDDGKDHWNISAFSNPASGLGKERFDQELITLYRSLCKNKMV